MKKTLTLDFSNKASNVSIDGDIVTKVWGEGLNWTKADAENVLADHSQYLEDLKSINFKTSDIFAREVVQKVQDQFFVIKETEAYGGKDLAANVLEAVDREALLDVITQGFKQTVRAMLLIPPRYGTKYSHDRPWFSVPVDVIPQNIVVDSTSKGMIFIDTFAPLLWSGDKLKSLIVNLPNENNREFSVVKFGDVRFSLGRLNGYLVALSTRWLLNREPATPIDDVDVFRANISDELISITKELLFNSANIETAYAQLLLDDASEHELRSIKHGDFEGPRYVQRVYKNQN